MIDSVSAPVEIVSNFVRANPLTNKISIHRYESVNGGYPRHVIEYAVYTQSGRIEKSQPTNIDIKV